MISPLQPSPWKPRVRKAFLHQHCSALWLAFEVPADPWSTALLNSCGLSDRYQETA